MDWQNLFFSAEGRIGRQQFWIGFVILWVAGWVLNFVPVIGQILSLVLIWCSICVYSKRLHDMGKTGWLQLIPFAAWFVAVVVAVVVGGAAFMAAAMNGTIEDPASAPGLIASLGGAVAVLGLAVLVNLVFLLWVGLSPSQPGENRFDPPKPEIEPAIA